MPSSAAARHTNTGSPTGSAAATSSNSRVAGGSGASRSVKLCSIRPDNAAGVGQSEPARELGGRPATRQPQQRQRVAARLGHDPITHPLVERTGDHGREQLARITLIQPADGELRQPLKMPLAARLAHGEHQPDRLRTETARDERQRLRRGHVEPLRVVHDADERSVFRDVGEQTEDRQTDEEPIRRIAVAQTERDAKRIALRAGKALDAIQKRRAQLLQPRVRELHLRLDSGRPGDAAPRRVLHQILQQRTLAYPGLTAQHQRPAQTRAHARHQLIQRRALAASAKQPLRGNGTRHRQASVKGWCEKGVLVGAGGLPRMCSVWTALGW